MTKPRPSLPEYSSPEVSGFHPAFEYAINEALASKDNSGIRAKHHYQSGTSQIDFVLLDSSQQVVLPIEIKRTRSDVRGIGRRQARDYWSNLGSVGKGPYYCVSNLEIVELFKFDSSRQTTSAQLLELPSGNIDLLTKANEDDFYSKLVACLTEVLDIVQNRQTPVFAVGMRVFQDAVRSALKDQTRWHKLFVPTCYEYIRGAATVIENLQRKWRRASYYQSQPSRLIEIGGSIDFQHVFCEPSPDPNDSGAFNEAVLKAAFESGKALGRGDDIAKLVNEILEPKAQGNVETDADLAQLLGIVAKAALGRDLLECEEIFDPACGSGSLLVAMPITAFPRLSPAQIRANEKEKLFSEALSLRLGLAFAHTISQTNAPHITISGIEVLKKECLQKVRIVVMNPPFISGVAETGLKLTLADRIQDVSGSPSRLDSGQIALEALFLELVWNLVEDGTVIATIFPTQHLYRLSPEVTKLRNFITDHFALTHLVIYPRKGLFGSVTKQTVVLVGVKGRPSEEASIIEIEQPLADINFVEFESELCSGNYQNISGASIYSIQRTKLREFAVRGWKALVGTGFATASFIESHMGDYPRLGDLPDSQLTRGKLGNHGNTKLTVFDSDRKSALYPSVVNLIPRGWLRPVLNTTEVMPRLLTKATAPKTSFQPPDEAYILDNSDYAVLQNIVNEYLLKVQQPKGPQPKKAKDISQVFEDLKSDQRSMGSGWVLVQRGSRTKGEIGLLEDDGVLVSTNVLMVKLSSVEERILLASWLLSVFGQMQLELFSVPQEGMRKLEIQNLKNVAYPDFGEIDEGVRKELTKHLEKEAAISFSGVIVARESDKLWAKVVNPSDAESCLDKAVSLLKSLVDERQGFG